MGSDMGNWIINSWNRIAYGKNFIYVSEHKHKYFKPTSKKGKGPKCVCMYIIYVPQLWTAFDDSFAMGYMYAPSKKLIIFYVFYC